MFSSVYTVRSYAQKLTNPHLTLIGNTLTITIVKRAAKLETKNFDFYAAYLLEDYRICTIGRKQAYM